MKPRSISLVDSKHQKTQDLNSSVIVQPTYIQSMNQSKFLEESISELKNQIYAHYQHMNGTCVCGQCVCGRCKCLVKLPDPGYPKDQQSLYQNEYKWKSVDYKKQKPDEEYKQTGDLKDKLSTYGQNFQPFKIQPQQQEKSKKFGINQPFSAYTSYSKDYPPQPFQQQVLMTPLNHYSGSSNLPHILKSTYREDYIPFKKDGNDFINFTKLISKKLHVKNDPNFYKNSTYSNVYKGDQGDRAVKIPQKGTFHPFGNAPGDFLSNYTKEYVPLKARKCPARVALESMSEQMTLKNFSN